MEFGLSYIGEGVHEGELIRWLVKEGDTVQGDQPLLEIMTDKATVEVPAPAAGRISGLQGKEGAMLKVGQVLGQIDEAAAGKAPAKPEAAPAPQAPKAQAPAPQAAAPAPQAPKAAPAPAPQQATSQNGGAGAYVGALEAHSPSSVPAAPIVRAMAQRAGVDLASVPGSGPSVGGSNRVLEEDLLRFLSNKGGTTAAPSAPARGFANGGEPVERVPLRGLRRVISNAMVKSKYTAPHYSYVDEFECSAFVEMREQARAAGEKQGVKITYLPFIVKALVGALREFPIVNSSLARQARRHAGSRLQEVLQHRHRRLDG